MPRRAFSDTAFFYALADSADRWHPNCELVFQQLEEQGLGACHNSLRCR
jgi:predicted nucleic acid-binding protein